MPVEGVVRFRNAPSSFADFAEPVEGASPAVTSPAGFEAFAEPVGQTNWSDTAKDVGHSLISGVGGGLVSLAGLPGDVAEYGARGIDRASRAIGDIAGIDVTKREDRAPTYGSADINSAVGDDASGGRNPIGKELDYEPKTALGGYAKTTGEFAPAAVAGPGGVIRNLITQAVIPAIASETAGRLTKGTWLEKPARLAAGFVAGTGGAVLSRPSSAQQILRRQLPEGITQQHIDHAEQIIHEAAARGVNLSWPEALSQAAGRPVLTDTMRMVESSPETRSQMQEFFGQRPQQFDQAALDSFQPIAPGTANPSSIGREASAAAEGHLTDVRRTINDAAEPFYQASEGVLLTPAEMQQVRQIPGFDDALEAVRNGPNAWRIQHLPDNSVGVLNQVKKHFDTAAENAGSRFNPMRNHETQATHEMQASAVRQIGELLSQDYRTALEIGRRGREQFLQPLLDGPLGRIADKPDTKKAIAVLFPSNPLPNSHNEIFDAVSVLARRNPWAARQLVRAYAEQTFNEATRSLQSGANQFGPASFAKAIVGNPQQRENLRAAVEALPNGQQLWQGFDRFLEIAEATRYRQTIGSKTAFNEADRKAMSAVNLGREAVKIGASPGKWWTIIGDKIDRWSLGRNLDELATLFTDPRAADLLGRIVRMPPNSSQAAAAAARLLVQANQSLNKRTDSSGPRQRVDNQSRR